MKKLILLLLCLSLTGCSMALTAAVASFTQNQIALIQSKMIYKERGVYFDITRENVSTTPQYSQPTGDKFVVKVRSVRPESDAQKAGLKVGDEVIFINGLAEGNGVNLKELFFYDEPIELEINRAGNKFTTKLMPL